MPHRRCTSRTLKITNAIERMTSIRTQPHIGRKAAATFIDYTLLFAFTFWYIFTVGKPDEEGVYTVSGIPALPPMLTWFLYLVVVERYSGATLGHKLFRLKVISLDGRELALGQIFKRRLADVLEITWCFGLVAFILVKSTPLHQRLGDIWAKTLVVDKSQSQQATHFDFEGVTTSP